MFNKIKFAKILSQINNTYNTMTEFAEKSGVNRTYLSQYINQKLDNPPTPKILEKIATASNDATNYEELMKICGYINLSNSKTDSIYINTDLSNTPQFFVDTYFPSAEFNEKQLIAFDEIGKIVSTSLKNGLTFNVKDLTKYPDISYHNLSNQEKQKVIEQVSLVVNSIYDLKKVVNSYRIPILGIVKAGYNWLAEENIIGYITDEETIKTYKNNINEYYALTVNGDSMLPLLSDGDLVIVHNQDDVESGQTAIILINGEEATVKKLIKTKEGIELHAMNPYYPVRKYSFEDMKNIPVRIIGRVKEAKIKGAFE